MASSTWAFSEPVYFHWATKRFFERAVIAFMVTIESGMVTTVINASNGEIVIIMISTPNDRERRREQHAERLLQALGDVVDVVGDPAQQVASRLAVDVHERQPVELVLDVAAEPVHRPLHHSGEHAVLEQRQHPGHGVDREHLEEDEAECAEIDRAVADQAVDDDVGGVAEDPGPDHRERDAGHREHEHGDDAGPFRSQPGEQAPDRLAEVLRPLDRHAHAEAAARAPLGDR